MTCRHIPEGIGIDGSLVRAVNYNPVYLIAGSGGDGKDFIGAFCYVLAACGGNTAAGACACLNSIGISCPGFYRYSLCGCFGNAAF